MAPSRRSAIVDVAWRVLVVAVAYTVVQRLLGLLTGPRPSLAPSYLQATAVDLVTGATYALVLLPLARRLPYRMRTRVLAMLVPLYWIALLGNIVEAYFITTLSRFQLTAGAVILALPSLAACWTIAWLLPAHAQERPAMGLRESLSQRPLVSWAWRTLLAGLLFAVFVDVFGKLWGPLIAKYYHDPAFMAQTHTVLPPPYIGWPDEIARGVVFVLVLLPVLAVMRGRDWPRLLALAAYVALFDAALESWLSMLAQTSWPLGFRLGEGLDLTSDAVVRGVIVAALLALPATTSEREVPGAAVALP